MTKKLVIKAYFFNWAGGSSSIYSPLQRSIINKCGSESFPFDMKFIPVDLPGRLARSTEDAIVDIPELAVVLTKELFPTDQNEPFVLFGHSYGAILAFKVAKLLEKKEKYPPLALFISACRAPSSDSITSHVSKAVSGMNFEEMIDYFKSRGSTISADSFLNDDIKRLFVDSVKADYKGLELYASNDYKLSCPIRAIGGDQDVIVSKEQILRWSLHQKVDESSDDAKNNKEIDFSFFNLKGRGHFYLNNTNDSTPDEISTIFLAAIKEVSFYMLKFSGYVQIGINVSPSSTFNFSEFRYLIEILKI